MAFFDALRDAWEELWHHKMRTALTLLGMIFGVGAVIAMLSIGEGAEQEALELIDSMGLRNVIVNAKKMDSQQLAEIRDHSVGLSQRDVEVASETLPFVEQASAEKVIKTFIVFSHGVKSDASVYGVTPSYFELSGFNVSAGRLFDVDGEARYRQVAVLGAHTAKVLFADKDPLGQLVKVNHVWLRVIGVLKDKSLNKDEFEGIKLGGEKNRIFVPLKTALKKFRFPDLDNEIDTFRIKITKDTDPNMAAIALNHLLSQRHGKVDDYEIVVPAKLMEQHRQTRRIFTIVMSCVAGISLLVGGIGIMNIMLATVLERTKEIGLLRAVGARKKDVMNLFMVESFTVAAIGGLLGIILGYIIAQVIAVYADWTVGWSLSAILLSVGVCAIVGLTFGIYPALKASKMDPIEALQRD
ncbi:ABC transporter permease [Aliikangiella coralliicola]|uniref:FtsX-like permease family protein n=1 Tax=Aliikangiella coralliicola TaxID=2592383 RepID=A0A545UI77_9GAMM|nr:ABC transporter permease [Aliikangiella coralliicola]TQV89171.1 FtsX-like permease family protein [Aliikangiella coralliicola]